MKKRRQSIWNQTCSPRKISLKSISVRTKVHQSNKNIYDLKRRRSQGNEIIQILPKNGDRGDECCTKRDTFKSLDTLFDVKKLLTLPVINNLSDESRDNIVESQISTTRNPKSVVHTLCFKPKLPNTDIKSCLLEQISDIHGISKYAAVEDSELNNNIVDDRTTTLEIMSTNGESKSGHSEIDELREDAAGSNNENNDGISEDCEDLSDDELNKSSSRLNDSDIIKEMKIADERCTIIAEEIGRLKCELHELTDKEDLTEEDAQMIQQKQEDVMRKLAEFELITQKLQKILGLSDPTNYTFAKVFGMLAYPGSKANPCVEKEMSDTDTDTDLFKLEVEKSLKKSKQVSNDDYFDVPKEEYPEDQLPRVIVCGGTEDNIPKIVIPDSERRGQKKYLEPFSDLSAKDKMYKTQEVYLEEERNIENLEWEVPKSHAEFKNVENENTELTQKSARIECACSNLASPKSQLKSAHNNQHRCDCSYNSQGLSPRVVTTTVCINPEDYFTSHNRTPRLSGGGSNGDINSLNLDNMCCRNIAATSSYPPQSPRGTCPAEIEDRLVNYGSTTKQLEDQLGNMEFEVRNMQIELANVQRERQHLEQQRKLLKCTAPCVPCSCGPSIQPNNGSGAAPVAGFSLQIPPTQSSIPVMGIQMNQPNSSCTGPCTNVPLGGNACPQVTQLRDLREQYARLQDDYKNKVLEVSCLRTDAEKLKQDSRLAKEEKDNLEIQLNDTKERLKIFENERMKFEGHKEQLVEQEQQIKVAKQRFREAQDELEELRSVIQDQAVQLEDYRNRYLQAQEMAEEQRRQLDLMEMDNARMNENVTLEIGRVKAQFQEKLAELAPFPDILKQTQIKLQEAQQLRMVAERQCEEFSRELLTCNEKIQTMQNQLNTYESRDGGDKNSDANRMNELEIKYNKLRYENERMKTSLIRFEEHEAQLQKRLEEKLHEVSQLSSTLEQVREDSARQVARAKERCETIKRSMQGQITAMEQQLAQCRAAAKAAQKDRDEIRQKLQGQINNLNEEFEAATNRIKSLQGHVNYLKNSYSNIFNSPAEVNTIPTGDTGTGRYDTCDYNY